MSEKTVLSSTRLVLADDIRSGFSDHVPVELSSSLRELFREASGGHAGSLTPDDVATLELSVRRAKGTMSGDDLVFEFRITKETL